MTPSHTPTMKDVAARGIQQILSRVLLPLHFFPHFFLYTMQNLHFSLSFFIFYQYSQCTRDHMVRMAEFFISPVAVSICKPQERLLRTKLPIKGNTAGAFYMTDSFYPRTVHLTDTQPTAGIHGFYCSRHIYPYRKHYSTPDYNGPRT